MLQTYHLKSLIIISNKIRGDFSHISILLEIMAYSVLVNSK